MKIEVDLSEFIYAINDDVELKKPLIEILNQPRQSRGKSIQQLIKNMTTNGAPEDLLNSILMLQNPEVAEKVLEKLK